MVVVEIDGKVTSRLIRRLERDNGRNRQQEEVKGKDALGGRRESGGRLTVCWSGNNERVDLDGLVKSYCNDKLLAIRGGCSGEC